ncbi:hypothetical protein IIA16_04045 [bacterium]|nr:hypothetical protein [bacterium]
MKAQSSTGAPGLWWRNLRQAGLVAIIVWVAWGPGGPERAALGAVAGALLGLDISTGLASGGGMPGIGGGPARAMPWLLGLVGAALGLY